VKHEKVMEGRPAIVPGKHYAKHVDK